MKLQNLELLHIKRVYLYLKNLSFGRRILLIVAIAIAILLAAVNLVFNALTMVSFTLIVTFISIICFLPKTREIRFNMKLKYLIILFFLTSLILVQLYSYIYYKNTLEIPYTVNEVLLVITQYFGISIKSLFLVTILLVSAISIGSVFFTKEFKKITLQSEQLFVSMLIGLGIIGSYYFLLGLAGLLILPVLIIPLILITLVRYKFLLNLAKGFFRYIEKKEFNLKFPLLLFIFSIIVFISIASIFSSLFRSFQLGPDALRDYLNMIKFLATEKILPNSNYIPQRTFFLAELIFTPAFQLGGVPVATVTMYSISSFFLVGLFFILKEDKRLTTSRQFILPLLFVFFTPFILNFYLYQYKIDIFLLLFSTGIFWLFYKYVKSQNLQFIYILAFISGIAVLIKITTIFFLLPLISYIAYIEFGSFKRNIKSYSLKIVLMGVLFLLPILPWLMFYRINTNFIGPIGLNLLNPKENTPEINLVYKEDDCSMLTYELKKTYKWEHGLKDYLIFPFLHMRGAGKNIKENMNIADPGLQLIVSISSIVLVIIHKQKKYLLSEDKILFKVVFTGFIIFMIIVPQLPWYFMIGYAIFYLLTAKYTSLLKTNRYLLYLAYTTISVYAFISIFLPFFSHTLLKTNIDTKSLERNYINSASEESYSPLVYSWFKLDEYLKNSDNSNKINILTFKYTAVNAPYFFDNFYNSNVYIDSDTSIEESNINTKDINGYVLNNVVNSFEQYPCIYEYNQRYKKLFGARGQKMYENKFFSVYSPITK